MEQIGTYPEHPLDPCSGDELTKAASILRSSGRLSGDAAFSCGFLHEPPKDIVLGFQPGNPFEREVRLIGHDPVEGKSFDALVSLAHEKLSELTWIEDGQAPVSFGDYFRLLDLIGASEDWAGALKKRGIEDTSLVHIEPWVSGVRHPTQEPNARTLRALAFVHEHPHDNYYARPVEGLMAFVDLDKGTVLIEDYGVVPVPREPAEYAAERVDKLRDDLKPLEITQPDGPSFEVEGHLIRWQKWRMRIAVTPVEGLVLYDVRYDDDGRDRPVLYRASLSDMVVPYGDGSKMHYWKHAFDAGEAMMGSLTNSLTLGCDCVGEIHYFDNTLLTPQGEAFLIENAVCLHEEDYGILWKHTNVFNTEVPPEVRRSRRLVISTVNTVGNYEYGFYWYFYTDGTIQMEIKLTGVVAVSVVGDGNGSDTAPLVAPGIASPIHQHLFCFRLDFNVDGPDNSVCEVDVEPLPPGPENPHDSGFHAVTRVLRTEEEAKREIDAARSRNWRVINPNVKNRFGNPVGYKLLPQATAPMLTGPNSLHTQRARFACHNLWVTPYAPDELYADAGPFTNLHSGEAGLPVYTRQNRNTENTDIVVWHSFGATHVPRPEDWPVMPVEYSGFTLMPVGFFDRNPALDVAPSRHCGD